jgi:formylglycine-generating enzyme
MNTRWIALTCLVFLCTLVLTGCGADAAASAPPEPGSTTVSSERWALIPAGDFLQGQFNQPTAIDNDYEMMVTLVTTSQYARFLNQAVAAGQIEATGSQVTGYYPGEPFDGYKHEEEIPAGSYAYLDLTDPTLRLTFENGAFTALPGYEDHPMTLVSWFGAQAYCEFYSWRLPTELEWEKGARGTDGRPFPWGETIHAGNANFYASRDPYEKTAGKSGDTTPVGFYNGAVYVGYATLNSPSPYGLYDMAGNVWQWTGDDYHDQHYRYLRGGSKAEYEPFLRVWTRNGAAPQYASPNAGFRCARSLP